MRLRRVRCLTETGWKDGNASSSDGISFAIIAGRDYTRTEPNSRPRKWLNMKQELITLDVCLNNGRNHVEVLQIVSAAADLVAETNPDVRLASFGIHSITNKSVAMALLDDAATEIDVEPAIIAEAEFHTGAGTRWAKFAELEDVAKRDSLSEAIQYELVEEGDQLSASYNFNNLRTLQDLLTLIARTNKHLHQRHISGSRDIWFSGIRNTTIPRTISDTGLSGKIAYHKLRIMRRDEQFQSLSRIAVSFDDKELRDMEAAVLFAFKE